MLPSKEKRIRLFLEREGVVHAPLPLRGDASTRSFYRIPWERGGAVLMVYEEPGSESERDFIELRERLAACGAPVPRVYMHDPAYGIILIEDCGDATLEEKIPGADIDAVRRYYRSALDILLRIQLLGAGLPGNCAALRRSFNREKLTWELDFFLVHTVEGVFGRKLEPGERRSVRSAFDELACRIASLPLVLNHRDYHSRNIMVRNGALAIVDFQDARLGPCQYDLASLLRDSYTILDGEFREEMLDYYLSGSAEMGVSWHDRGDFLERFDLVSMQRNLKACGTFGYMAARGNERYLKYLAPTFSYLKEVSPRFGFMRECMEMLARYVPPLRQEDKE